jgi:hypothetical protein
MTICSQQKRKSVTRKILQKINHGQAMGKRDALQLTKITASSPPVYKAKYIRQSLKKCYLMN